MKKSEIKEIKDLLKKDSLNIAEFASCYVDINKEIKLKNISPFFNLEEDIELKYLTLLKSSLSGSIKSNLIEIPFSVDNEINNLEHKRLLNLLENKFSEDNIDEFFNLIINNYKYAGNYLVLLIKLNYDIPSITSDNILLEDASDLVYTGILCVICPVKLSKEEIIFNQSKNLIEKLNGELVIKKPLNGFLFPSFNDRSQDIHNALFYTSKKDVLDIDFIKALFNEEPPLTKKEIKASVSEAMTEAFGEKLALNNIIDMYDEINEKIQLDEEYVFNKDKIKEIMINANIDEEGIDNYINNIKSNVELTKDTIFDKTYVQIQNQGIDIRVDTEYLHYINTKEIDGRKCIVIYADDYVNINGIPVSTI